MSRPNLPALAPPMLRANQTAADPVRPKDTPPADHAGLAADLFDAALDASGLTTGEAAYLLGVSESLIRRMRSKDARETVSLVQMVKLGPVFLWHFHVQLHRTCNFQRQALRECVQSLGLLTVGID